MAEPKQQRSDEPLGQCATPPREWFEKNFVHDGKVHVCSECRAIPFAFIGHWCRTIEARSCGIVADIEEKPYRWQDVVPVQNDDRPGDWCLMFAPGEGTSADA